MRKDSFKAFTILEVSIVMVMIGIITSLIYNGIFSFNLQMKNDVKLKQELTDFSIFRANLYRDLLGASSFIKNENGIQLAGEQHVFYELDEKTLIRRVNDVETTFDFKVNELEIKSEDYKRFYLNLDWRGQELLIEFPIKADVKKQVNEYFKEFELRRIK